ncbi:OB-fold domain-containing protein [Herbidospora sp. NBRC 101105]|uniref:Zn-ribbon domain-containing OB-fold protein n=1 Tax=Herbidospora sp. NBRC 101105 TaxID=3032195 RepID=UPI0024A4B7AF|nr:OB-fold domain-containing protein [Herbidospora sp. NBRC 101105]GLX98424.1 DNA-binding protein [Herbidospora sp. NBRC 101105]
MPSEPNPEINHVLEFPGGYTRSTGPVIGRFLTELRAGRIVGVRTAGRRVLVPPLEYDPATGDPVTDEFVEVGPAGTVREWTWVEEPRKNHPLDRPFAWALIRLDGADTALVHAVDAPVKAMRTGLRVWPRWRHDRVGSITDLECFVPEVTTIVANVRTEYTVTPGAALKRYLDALTRNVFLAGRCATCSSVYVPYRLSCPQCGSVIEEELEVGPSGTVTTFAINNLPDPRAPQVPFVSAYILLDGADTPIIALLGSVAAGEVTEGMRVRAVFEGGTVKWFAPVREA